MLGSLPTGQCRNEKIRDSTDVCLNVGWCTCVYVKLFFCTLIKNNAVVP